MLAHGKDGVMIRLVTPLTLDGRFSAQDLPGELPLTLLNDLVAPRIVSSSMLPTIQEGDKLELSPPTSLTVDAIVVFRHDSLLICHRITAIDPQGTLTTRGDATQGSSEIVPPDSVIGVVTGVIRKGARVSFDQHPQMSSATTHPGSLTSRTRTVVTKSVTETLRILAQFSLFQPTINLLLYWVATVDVLTLAPLQSLHSHSKVASCSLRTYQRKAGHLAVSEAKKPACFVIRLGPWRFAQYDPATESLLLRRSFQAAGLEPLIRQYCGTL